MVNNERFNTILEANNVTQLVIAPGSNIGNAIDDVIAFTQKFKLICYFEFNGLSFMVSRNTTTETLHRQFDEKMKERERRTGG